MIVQADEAEKERALQELEKQREREVRRRIYKVPKPSDELCIMNNARQIIQDEYTNVSHVNNTTARKGKVITKVNKEKKLTMKSRVGSEMKTWK